MTGICGVRDGHQVLWLGTLLPLAAQPQKAVRSPALFLFVVITAIFQPQQAKHIYRVGIWVRVRRGTVMKNPIWAICERLSEIQAILEAHLEAGKYRTDEVPHLIREILSEDGLREAMDTVGYLSPNVPRH